MPGLRRWRLEHQVGSYLWLIPLLCLLGGVALSLLTTAIDRAADYGLVPQSVTGTPTDVQTILNTAGTSLVSLTSVVLSLTLVAVQLAMGQFSPRIVRTLLTDRRNQFAIGLFIGTFAYTLLVLREVNDNGSGGGTVPGFSVLVSYVLILASVVVLVLFVHHAGQSIRVAGLIDLVGDSTREEIERMYPAPDPPAPDPEEVSSPTDGVVVKVHSEALVDVARRGGCVLEMVPSTGDFVARESPLFRVVEGELPDELRREALRCVLLGAERTHIGDVPYGIRKLVDIAERSIASSPFDDPTTAVQAIHRLHDCLGQLAVRDFPSGRHTDADGHVRLVMPTLDWDGYVRLGCDEIRLAGAGSPQVARRLRAMLDGLKSVAPPERHPPLDRQIELLSRAVERSFEDDDDVAAGLAADLQGIGSGDDLAAEARR
jgi:uncharacterized membrane protein